MEPEYTVVETQTGEGIVAVTPDGASVPRDVDPASPPLPLDEAQEIVDKLNSEQSEEGGDHSGGGDESLYQGN